MPGHRIPARAPSSLLDFSCLFRLQHPSRADRILFLAEVEEDDPPLDNSLEAISEEDNLQRAIDALSRLHSAATNDNYMFLFRACIKAKSLTYTRRVYAHLSLHRSRPATGLLGEYLVAALASCGAVDEARHVSRRLPYRSAFCWTSIISSYDTFGQAEEALEMHRKMQEEGVESNQYTFSCLFQACGSMRNLREGKRLHDLAQRKGFASSAFVGTALVNMYNKFGDVAEAEAVFSKLSQRDIISWTAMLTLYVDHGHGEKALQLYREIQTQGALADDRVFVVTLQACGILAEHEEACIVDGRLIKEISLDLTRALHADARRMGYGSNIYVCTTLVSVYGKCGAVSEAEEVFSRSFERNIVTWNAMLSAFIELQLGDRALYLYRCMQKEHVAPDDVTFICVLQGCSETGSFEACKDVHFNIITTGYDQDHSVMSTLIHGYGSCGSMADAEATFYQFSAHDTVSWSACISGHAGEGNCRASLNMYALSLISGIQPNEITFTAVLVACSHAGLVMEGLHFFSLVTQNTLVVLNLKHFNTLIDLLGRAGNFRVLENILKHMPVPADLTFWLCILSICRIHGNVELAKQAFDHAVYLEPKHPALYVFMSNIYADAGLQEFAAQIQSSMQMLGFEGAWKEFE